MTPENGARGRLPPSGLLAELYDREIDRLQGKPHTTEPPKNYSPSDSQNQLQEAIRNLFSPPPEPSPPQTEQPN